MKKHYKLIIRFKKDFNDVGIHYILGNIHGMMRVMCATDLAKKCGYNLMHHDELDYWAMHVDACEEKYKEFFAAIIEIYGDMCEFEVECSDLK